MSGLRVHQELVPMRTLVICHPRPELTTRFRFLELGDLDVSQAALETMHLVAKARRLD